MGVRIVVGRAGSGKSLRCFRAIVDAMGRDPLGEPIYFIVPKQETFSAERDLTCTSGLKGFTRTRILSFELLGEEILAECGGTAIPQVTELGRQMIIGHLLRKFEDQLQHYKSSARQVGLAAELDSTFGEFERAGRTVADLSQLIEQLHADPTQADLSAFTKKLTDLRLLYDEYQKFLGQERLDPHRRLQQVLASLEGCKRIQRSTIYVDGFLDFTDYERKMLAGLAKVCREMEITLLLDPASKTYKDPHHLPDELGLFYRTEETFRKLWFALTEAGIQPQKQELKSIARFESPSLKLIEQHFASARPPICQTVEKIELIEAADRRAEVDAAARHVRELVHSGLRFREIAVLMGDLNDYHELIDASFREHDIPYFVDRRRSAGHHPLLQFTRAILQIALHGWPHEAAMALLKSQLAGLSRDEVDELENYVLLHRIRGSAWTDPTPWQFQRRLTRGNEDDLPESERIELARIDAMRRRVVDRIAPWTALFASNQAIAVRAIVVGLFQTFERFDVRSTLSQWMKESEAANRLDERDEHKQVWTELVELLDQMVDVVGDEQVTLNDFVDVLETGLDRFDLALTPPTVDQVIVGSVDRTRSARPKATILLGMNDNQFPKPPRDGSILSDGERRTLSQHHVELDPDTQRTLLDEQLLGYIAFTRASQSLCLSRAIADDEARPQSPSDFWQKLRAMFPALEPRRIPRESKSLTECIGTPRQLVTALMSWVRHADTSKRDTPWPSLYHWLATHECCSDAIDTMRYRAWKALSYQNDAKLSAETAKRLFTSPLTSSVSRIESFATCPFKHFVQYGLGLRPRDEQEVTAIDLGNACHSILERIIRQMVGDKLTWADHSPGGSDALISRLAKQVAGEIREELMLSSARNEYILQRIEKTISQVMDAQCVAGQRGSLAPWKAELQFGDARDLPALVINTPAGRELRLRGKIDRVDLLEDGAAFAVIDYKYRGSALSLDHVYHGLSLQLLTYLLVLQKHGQALAKRPLTPVGAFYVQLLRQLEKVAHPDEATPPDDPKFHLQTKPRGIIDFAHRQLFDAEHESRMSDVVQVYVNKEGLLGNRNNTDACESHEFAAILQLVERKLGELADGILAGDVSVSPYRINATSPCSYCEFRSVCRFDPAINRYHHMPSMKREEVLTRVLEDVNGCGETG
jgi:ATP-dependent helicase/nuclease subunit B